YEIEPEVQKDFLNTINEQTDRLTQLVGDFLDLARIESGQIDWSVGLVQIGNVIERAVSYTKQMACGMNIRVETEIAEGLPPVTGDTEKLVQVLSKLVRNAVIFSYSGGKVTIKAEKGEVDESMAVPATVKVSVIDNGVGIAPSDQEDIFEKFTQVGDVLDSKPPGAGLGLAICRGIIQQHGGDIWVESEPGKGSTFYFTLPVSPQQTNTRKGAGKNE
ncbi:MAG: HAMP domain-containing sensor histidine kinase, partial [Dehalococcoidia bacterium]